MNKRVLLCVDDEPIVLSSLKEHLKRSFAGELTVETAESGEAALEAIEAIKESGDELRVLLCDQMMPGIKGDQVITKLYREQPAVRSILLTGHTDVIGISNIINYAQLYRYIMKPWEPDDLNLTIREANKSYEQQLQIEKQWRNLEDMNQQLIEFNRNLEAKVRERTMQLAEEQRRSEELLRNILPDSIAARLKAGEVRIADRYESVSVVFADIVNFTRLSQTVTAEELVRGLDLIFSRFDALAERHNLEKIKTIGDSYMAVAGAPKQCVNHVEVVAKMAVEMLDEVALLGRIFSGQPIGVRIGIHIGEVVAGVIGSKKIAYDLWGDAVNTAARMESHGEPGKIHCSEDFAKALIARAAVCNVEFSGSMTLEFSDAQHVRIEPRGAMNIKGKGEMKTFFIS